MKKREIKLLELEQTRNLVPKNYKKIIDQDLIDELNNLILDPEYGEQFKEDFLTYNNVLEHNSNWSLRKYVDAIKYYSLIQAGESQVDAYCKVFPDRLADRMKNGQTKTDMAGEASRYNKSQLVNKIRTQSLVPLHLVNQHNVQLAINTLADQCVNARYDRDKIAAATALLKELKAPETAKLEIDMKVDTGDAIADLRRATRELAEEHAKSLAEGSVELKQLGALKPIDVDIEEE